MTEAMPFLQNYDITFLRPPPIPPGGIFFEIPKKFFRFLQHNRFPGCIQR